MEPSGDSSPATGVAELRVPHLGILPIGKGRSAYISAMSLTGESDTAQFVFRPLNRAIVNHYRSLVGTEITIYPANLSKKDNESTDSEITLENTSFRLNRMRSVSTDTDSSYENFWDIPFITVSANCRISGTGVMKRHSEL